MNIERDNDDGVMRHGVLVSILENALSLADEMQLSMAAIHISSAIETLRQGMDASNEA